MSNLEHNRLKILLSCYACNPNYGSEPGTGWKFVYHLAKYHNLHVLVESDECKDDILRYKKEHPEELKNVTFHFIKRYRNKFLRKIWPPSYYWCYRYWQKKAYNIAKKLDKQEDFDLIHQITLIGYREPGYLWKLDKPFIWGPLGGFCQTKWCLLKGMKLRDILYFSMRNIINAYQKRFSMLPRKAATHAHTIFVSDPEAVDTVQKRWHCTPRIMREVGISSNIISQQELSTHHPKTPLRICWAGELISLKALELLLDAIALCKNDMQLEVMGKGRELKTWTKHAKKLKISDKVNFRGYVKHDDIRTLMSACHVFCITSLKEGGTPTVSLEALQCGLPLIALDHCGFASVVNDTCGVKIPIQSRKQISEDIAFHLDKLAEDEILRYRLAQGALKRSLDFTWEAKMDILNEVYKNANLSRNLSNSHDCSQNNT
ncbi:MAG: glycosyltransferase family 4 protein [Akkermansia sp.]|nr:glycosyltransferase family 4 protein [Akkermansia sp.]MBQ4637000.1 glycosyltransferase family 4 protein [Akkermansia sp.]